VIDPAVTRDEVCDLFIDEGVIKGVGSLPSTLFAPPYTEIDARGLLVVPGLIDMHVHLREPGREDEETIETGTRAAVHGGFTAVCCMPNTEPPLDSRGVIEFVQSRSRECGSARVYPVGAITKGLRGEELTEIRDLVEGGAVAISDDGRPVANSELMRRALEYSRMFDLPVISHCEDLSLSAGGVMHEGFFSTLLGLRGIPAAAEEVVVARDLALCRLTGARLHVAHVSTAGAVELIRRAKQSGLRVTAETAPHYFALSDGALAEYDTNCKVNPPLRCEYDVETVREGLADGTIDVIASDHAPHTVVEKEVEFNEAPFGMIGLETTLGLVFTELVARGVLPLPEAIRKMSANPAALLSLPLGTLKVGAPADITLIDPEQEWVVAAEDFASRSTNSAFLGRKLKGKALMTMIAGRQMGKGWAQGA
jgi:dihydroorotase